MGENRTYTFEFKEESQIPEKKDFPEEIKALAEKGEVDGKYISIKSRFLWENTDLSYESSIEDKIEYLFEKTDAQRIAYSFYQNTSCWNKIQLFERNRDGVNKITEINDTEASEPRFSSWELDEHYHEHGAARDKIEEEYDFKAKIRI